MKKEDILIALSLFSIALLVRATNISIVPFWRDEWSYMEHTGKILANRFVPIAEVFQFVPPTLSYVGAVFTLLFEGDLNTLRMISVIFGSLTVPLLYFSGKVIYNRSVGLLSAIFLCISPLHCLWSRMFMMEAFALFFITAFLYFFWLSRRSVNASIIAGVMLGLAIDAKFVSFFLPIAVLIYVLWVKRLKLRALLEKRMVLIYIFAALLFSPVIFCWYYTGLGWYPLYFQALGRYEDKVIAGAAVRQTPMMELLARSIDDILYVFANGSGVLPWATLFNISTLFLLVIVPLFYIPALVKRDERDSFPSIFFITTLAFIFIACPRHYYYLIYSFPTFFIMLSHVTIELIKHRNSALTAFVLFTVVILFISYVVAGATSPYWNMGDLSCFHEAVLQIKRDTVGGGEVTIGALTIPPEVEYFIELHGLNASVFSILGYERGGVIVNYKRVSHLKPTYILATEHQYEYYLSSSIDKILEDYEVILHYKTYPYGCYVLKRKCPQTSETQMPKEDVGELDDDVFKRSIPGVMRVGETYTALVQVRNKRDSPMSFTVVVHSDEHIFVYEDSKKVLLNPRSVRMLKFKIVPMESGIGRYKIVADLYARNGTSEEYVWADSVADNVFIIK
ncbi:MAG: hypothetical protein DRN06_02415 [Thermoprotei archaeon]|nr:MAG: hypothetical protein DRN06_02415 [Thermoprotei archaeon]